MLNKFWVLFILLLGFVPGVVYAAGADLKMSPGDIRFSKSQLVSGETVRIYTKVQNIGTVDVVGYVTFYQGSVVIDEPQVISVVAGSNPEEVFVDFVVPQGAFNVRTVISGTKPVDINLDNNVAITGMFTPVLDDDHDGIPNGTDNCVTVSNANQLDTDHDGLGNACDDDMDGDTLSNSVESEIGSNPLLKDTDGDGVDDAHDAYPLDAKRWILEKPVLNVKVLPKPTIALKSAPEATTKDEPVYSVQGAIKPLTDISNNTTEERTENKTSVDTFSKRTLSPNAVFMYEKTAWNKFVFRVVAPLQDKTIYEWNFGDGVKSSKSEIQHTYLHSGTFHISLKTTNEKGEVSEETSDVQVAFFNFSNPLVFGFIFLLLVIMIVLIVVVKKMKKEPIQIKPVSSPKQIHVKEE